jgi:hypothetical protein
MAAAGAGGALVAAGAAAAAGAAGAAASAAGAAAGAASLGLAAKLLAPKVRPAARPILNNHVLICLFMMDVLLLVCFESVNKNAMTV